MTSYLQTSKRRNILLMTIFLTLVFIIINIALYYLNESFVAEKIEEENHAFSTLTTHLINENDLAVALEYMEHYSHTHDVELALRNASGDTLFTTSTSDVFDHTYTVQTLQGEFDILIDNTGSVTLDWAASHFLYVNFSLILIYFIAIIVFLWVSKDASRKVNSDIDLVLDLINKDHTKEVPHHYQEFYEIYIHIREYLEEIDLLKEQKNMNVKGLVHDIKTPLTLLRYYLDMQVESEEKEDAIKALSAMNNIVQDLMHDEYHKSTQKIDVQDTLEDIIRRYEGVFSSKSLTLDLEVDSEASIKWNSRDFTRVIENLLSNAFYYSDEGTTVTIEVRKEDSLIIEIKNKGDRLKENELLKLFEKGYRKKESMNKHTEGQGLGLYSSKLLLSSIGASIAMIQEDEWTIVKIIF